MGAGQGRPQAKRLLHRGAFRGRIFVITLCWFSYINRNLLPWGSKDRDGQKESDGLTPAEWLFGVVEGGEEKDKQNRKPSSLNLASRVRFSDARSLNPTIKPLAEIPLKILSSPKPPSPAMYFKGGPAKKNLSMELHKPNGRKYYVPHKNPQGAKPPWQTGNNDNPEQKCRCTPLPAGSVFYFHIDFDNLSDAELELLLAAIKPAEDFRHRLGLGKPLGLGSVLADIKGVFIVDRVNRYGVEALKASASRYAETSQSGNWDDGLAKRYPAEQQAISQSLPQYTIRPSKSFIDQDTLEILKTLGADPRRRTPDVQVRYPMAHGQQNSETEGFKWFVNNDRTTRRKYLETMEKETPLKPLESN